MLFSLTMCFCGRVWAFQAAKQRYKTFFFNKAPMANVSSTAKTQKVIDVILSRWPI